MSVLGGLAATLEHAVTSVGPQLLLLGVGAFLLAAVLAPVGTLRWWAGRGATAPGAEAATPDTHGQPHDDPDVEQYLVYIPGVDAYSTEWLSRRETRLLEILSTVPRLRIVRDVFAYQIAGRPPAEEPMTGRFWRWLHAQRVSRRRVPVLGNLLSIRNVLQVGVSVDPRYGPIYNFGVAELVRHALLRSGYTVGNGKRITLLGYSGGGQLALGVVLYLKRSMRAPVNVISVGGVLCDDPSLDNVDRLVHLFGSRDWIQRLGVLLFPGRWSIALGSHWHRALAAGRIQLLCLGPMKHTGRGAYFDDESKLRDGQSFLHRTAGEIMRTLVVA